MRRAAKSTRLGTMPRVLFYKKGETIIKPSNKITQVYFLKSGLVRQYWISQEGEVVTIHIFKPGSLFPIMLAFVNKPNRYYFEAFSAVELQGLSASTSIESIKNNPELLYEFTQNFANAIHGLSQRVEMLAIFKVPNKILLFLDYLAKNFGRENISGKIDINLKFTHSEIAAWVGTRRETVSRRLGILSKAGIITLNKSRLIIDKELFDEEKARFGL